MPRHLSTASCSLRLEAARSALQGRPNAVAEDAGVTARAAQLDQEAAALELGRTRFEAQASAQLKQLEWREQQVARLEEQAQALRDRELAMAVRAGRG